MAAPEIIEVPVVIAVAPAANSSLRHALWRIDQQCVSRAGENLQACNFVLTDDKHVQHEPRTVVDGPEWCERAAVPASEWQSAITLAGDWHDFSAGQPLAQVNCNAALAAALPAVPVNHSNPMQVPLQILLLHVHVAGPHRR
jgi:hypothetical protein